MSRSWINDEEIKEEINKQIMILRKQGKSLREIAKQTDTPKSTVDDIIFNFATEKNTPHTKSKLYNNQWSLIQKPTATHCSLFFDKTLTLDI